MPPKLYQELVSWYRLLDPLDEHRDEGREFATQMLAALGNPKLSSKPRLLELGAGAGNTAYFLKDSFDCTLTDLSSEMLQLSKDINSDCEHLLGDMRDLRLDRKFDAVFVHDAICYLTKEEELVSLIATIAHHLRPGGVALLVPDDVRETFCEETELYQGADGQRSMRCLEWMWDPEPNDTWYRVDYAFLLNDNGSMRAIHDTHVEGLFSVADWERVLTSTGMSVRNLTCASRPEDADLMFLCRQPD